MPTPAITDEKFIFVCVPFNEIEVTQHKFFWLECTIIYNNVPWLFTGCINDMNSFELVGTVRFYN